MSREFDAQSSEPTYLVRGEIPDDKSPSFDQVKRKLDLADDVVDPSFGVAKVDPRERSSRREGGGEAPRFRRVEGPFSDPKIETFGPPKS